MPIKNNIKSSLEELNKTDIYSMILFSLYKMKDIPEYSTLSELAYIMDKDSLFNFLEVYGGLTIKVPSLYELKTVIFSLLLYQYIQIEHLDMEQALKNLDDKEVSLKDIKETYIKLNEIISNYDFKRN